MKKTNVHSRTDPHKCDITGNSKSAITEWFEFVEGSLGSSCSAMVVEVVVHGSRGSSGTRSFLKRYLVHPRFPEVTVVELADPSGYLVVLFLRR